MTGVVELSEREQRLLSAFTDKWERLGDVAERIGDMRPKLITAARNLRSAGLLESRYHGQNYQWRLRHG